MAEYSSPTSDTFEITGHSMCDFQTNVKKYETHLQNQREQNNINFNNQENKKTSSTSGETLNKEITDCMAKVSLISDDFKPEINSPDYLTKYAAKVDFALKLGYTESLAQIALSHVGVNSSQNDLLEELIKLESSPNTDSDNDDDILSKHPIERTFLKTEDIKSICCPKDNSNALLRPIVIDGSNVAISHGNKEIFSCRGIKLCVEWFKKRGHTDITVFVPKWRKENKRFENPINDQEILNELERDRMLVFTPSRLIGGKRMVCYDDRYILKLAVENQGIVVSNDNYRDLIKENPEFKKVVEERILMYSFVNDRFMPPDDPLGRLGPNLDDFLRILPRKNSISSPCPYGKKCTYGNRCKFYHPEKDFEFNKLFEKHTSENVPSKKLARKSLSYPLNKNADTLNDFGNSQNLKLSKKRLCRTKSNKEEHYVYEFDTSTKTNHKTLSRCSSIQNSTLLKNSCNDDISKVACNYFDENKQYENGFHDFTLTQNTQNVDKLFPQKTDGIQPIHKKLRRQLTLNMMGEAECPKSLHMDRKHKTLAPSFSNPTIKNLHKNITRTSSAPSSIKKGHNFSSALNKNDFTSAKILSMTQEIEEKRCKLYYHLSNVFPRNQVWEVMEMLPNETNPRKICAAILSLYSNG